MNMNGFPEGGWNWKTFCGRGMAGILSGTKHSSKCHDSLQMTNSVIREKSKQNRIKEKPSSKCHDSLQMTNSVIRKKLS